MTKPDEFESRVLDKLDKILLILQLAFKEQIDAAREEITRDVVVASVLEATSAGWIDAGQLRAKVAQETKQSERTVNRRMAILVSQHILEQDGTGPNIRYRSSGLL